MSAIFNYFRAAPSQQPIPIDDEGIVVKVSDGQDALPPAPTPPEVPPMKETVAVVDLVAEAFKKKREDAIAAKEQLKRERDAEIVKTIMKKRADIPDQLGFEADVLPASVRNHNRCIYVSY